MRFKSEKLPSSGKFRDLSATRHPLQMEPDISFRVKSSHVKRIVIPPARLAGGSQWRNLLVSFCPSDLTAPNKSLPPSTLSSREAVTFFSRIHRLLNDLSSRPAKWSDLRFLSCHPI